MCPASWSVTRHLPTTRFIDGFEARYRHSRGVAMAMERGVSASKDKTVPQIVVV